MNAGGRNRERDNFCPERTLSDRMFLKRLQGGHRQIRRSEDFEEEQATRVIGEEQPGQDMVLVALRIPLWNRNSLACSSVSVIR